MLSNRGTIQLSSTAEAVFFDWSLAWPALPDSLSALADVRIAGNPATLWGIALGVTLAVALVLRFIQGFVLTRWSRRTEQTRTRLDDVGLDVIRATSPVFHLAIGVLLGRSALDLSPNVQNVLRVAFVIVIGYQLGRWAQTAVVQGVGVWAESREGSQNATLAAGLRFLGRLTIWSLVLLAILSNLGIELSAIVAGLGVGGVAAALAVQSTLGDLIAGVSMYFDRPFDIGDFIIVDGFLGTVQKIGTRTTRVASLGGEEIVFPNGDLARARIRNYARMKERRVVFGFRIQYNLPAAKIQRARDIAADVVKAREGVRFDRAHFKEYGPYSLDYEVVYYVLSPDYNVYMDHQHAINLAIYEKFEAEGIPFAIPTQTLFTKSLDAA